MENKKDFFGVIQCINECTNLRWILNFVFIENKVELPQTWEVLDELYYTNP